MLYQVHTDIALPGQGTLVFPISLGEPHHTGNKLKALLQFAKNFQKEHPNTQVIILVADTLRRWNVGLTEAKNMGDEFIRDNADDLKGLTVLRWYDWIEKYKVQYEDASNLIEYKYRTDITFRGKIKKTFERNKNKKGKSLETSIMYQKEEYALILTMQGMYLVYPAKPSSAWNYLYTLFQERMPIHMRITYKRIDQETVPFSDATSFNKKRPVKIKNSPFSIELLTNSARMFLERNHVSTQDKSTYSRIIYACLPSNLECDTLTQEEIEIISDQTKAALQRVQNESHDYALKLLLKNIKDFLKEEGISLRSKIQLLEEIQGQVFVYGTQYYPACKEEDSKEKIEYDSIAPQR